MWLTIVVGPGSLFVHQRALHAQDDVFRTNWKQRCTQLHGHFKRNDVDLLMDADVAEAHEAAVKELDDHIELLVLWEWPILLRY